MKYVYRLHHNHKIEPDGDKWICDTKSLGYYSTRAKVKKAIRFYKTVIGFKDHPNDFETEKVPVDFDDYDFV